MKSSFKKDYKKTLRKDGSVELEFPQVSGLGCGPYGCLVVYLFVALLLAYPVIWAFERWHWDKENITVLIPLAIPFTFLIWHWMNTSKGRITVVPGEGLKFGRKQLPFSELSALYHECGDFGCMIFARAHGKDIRLTKAIPDALAAAIVAEIKASSGGSLH